MRALSECVELRHDLISVVVKRSSTAAAITLWARYKCWRCYDWCRPMYVFLQVLRPSFAVYRRSCCTLNASRRILRGKIAGRVGKQVFSSASAPWCIPPPAFFFIQKKCLSARVHFCQCVAAPAFCLLTPPSHPPSFSLRPKLIQRLQNPPRPLRNPIHLLHIPHPLQQRRHRGLDLVTTHHTPFLHNLPQTIIHPAHLQHK